MRPLSTRPSCDIVRGMSAPQNNQEVPAPDSDWMRDHQADAPATRSLTKMARLWRPFGTFFETGAATIARYAHRLIDRTTGKAYSADELEAKILAGVGVPAHTHTSSGITDASFGGNGAADANKVPKFDSVGALMCSYRFTVREPAGPHGWSFVQGLAITQPREIKLYDADGFMVLGKPFLDESAAISGGVQVGDIWFDLTLNKPRVRLS